MFDIIIHPYHRENGLWNSKFLPSPISITVCLKSNFPKLVQNKKGSPESFFTQEILDKNFFLQVPLLPLFIFFCLFEFHKFIVNLIFTHMEFWVYVTGIPVLWSEYFLTFFCTQTPFRRVTRIHLYFNRCRFSKLGIFSTGRYHLYFIMCSFSKLGSFLETNTFFELEGEVTCQRIFFDVCTI